MKRLMLLAFAYWLTICVCAAGEIAEHRYTTEQIKQDFTYLYQTLQDAQYDLFHAKPKAEYDAAYKTMQNAIDGPMSQLQAQVYFQRFLALAKTAHTRIDFPIVYYRDYVNKGGRTLPLYLRIENDEVVVDEYFGAVDLLVPGTEIVAVNSMPVREWLKPLYQHVSADNLPMMWSLAGQMLPGLLWLEDGEKAVYDITVVGNDGKSKQLQIPTLTQEQQDAIASAKSGGPEEDTSPLREHRILTGNVGYLKPGPFYNAEGDNVWDPTHFKGFIDEAFNAFNQAQTTAAIIDLRGNPGGTNGFSDHMLAWFATQPFKFASDFRVKVSRQAIEANEIRLKDTTDKEDVSHQLAAFYASSNIGESFSFPLQLTAPHSDKHYTGDIYVLIDRYSYSNAVSVAAIIKDYEFGTLIGEKTADVATTYGAMEHFSLPNTGIDVGFPKALIIRPNGNEVPDGVTPDIVLEAGGVDGLEQATAIVLQRTMAGSL